MTVLYRVCYYAGKQKVVYKANVHPIILKDFVRDMKKDQRFENRSVWYELM